MARYIVTALLSSTKVFTQVTLSGSRGNAGGGQNGADNRKIRNEPMRPLNSIISDAISISTASIPLEMKGRSRSSPAVSREPALRGVRSGRILAVVAVTEDLFLRAWP